MAEGLPKFSWVKKQGQDGPSSPPITTFTEIMSETLANELQEVRFRASHFNLTFIQQDLLEFDQEQEALEASLREFDMDQELENDCSNDLALAMALSEDPDYSVDMSIALELQRQFDREDELQQQLESDDNVVTKRGTTSQFLKA